MTGPRHTLCGGALRIGVVVVLLPSLAMATAAEATVQNQTSLSPPLPNATTTNGTVAPSGPPNNTTTNVTWQPWSDVLRRSRAEQRLLSSVPATVALILGGVSAIMGGATDAADVQVLLLGGITSCGSYQPPNGTDAVEELHGNSTTETTPSPTASINGNESTIATEFANATQLTGGQSSILLPIPTGMLPQSWNEGSKNVLATCLLILLVTVLLAVASFAVASDAQSGGVPQRVWAGSARTWFPSVPLALFGVLSQGVAVSAVDIAARGDPAAAALLVVVVAVLVVLMKQLAPACFHEAAEGEHGGVTGFFRHVEWNDHQKTTMLRFFTSPLGFWAPCPTAMRFGGAFGPFRPPNSPFLVELSAAQKAQVQQQQQLQSKRGGSPSPVQLSLTMLSPKPMPNSTDDTDEREGMPSGADVRPAVVLSLVLRPLIFGVCAGLPPHVWGSCNVQHVFCALLGLITALLCLVFKPYRWELANASLALSSFFFAAVNAASHSAVPVTATSNVSLDTIVAGIAVFLFVCKIASLTLIYTGKHARNTRIEQLKQKANGGASATSPPVNHAPTLPNSPQGQPLLTVPKASPPPRPSMASPQQQHPSPPSSNPLSRNPHQRAW